MTEHDYKLLNDIKEIYEKYPIEKENPYKENPFAIKMRTELNYNFERFVADHVDNEIEYKVKTHTGVGNWTNFPWIGVRNQKITTSFQNGIYIDIKLNLYDREHGLEMMIIQGIVENPFSQEELTNIFNTILKNNPIPAGFAPHNGEGFGLIFKSYNIDNLTEDILDNELLLLLNYYKEIIDEYKELTTINISQDFKEISEQYPIEKNNPLKNNPLAQKISNKFTNDLQFVTDKLTSNKYIAKISYGQGRWAQYPWAGIRNEKVASNFLDGLYVIYHFDYDKQLIYLSINQGLDKYSGSKKEILVNRAKKISEKLSFIPEGFIIDNDTVKDYHSDETSVLSKCYTINELNEDIIEKDLKTILDVYEEIIHDYISIIENNEDKTIAKPLNENNLNLSIEISMLKTNLKIENRTLNQVCTLLNAGKHIILEGVPGTGKTELAIDIGKTLNDNNFCNGYILTTATSDWTTFDTIGGLMPDEEGNLQFNEGIFLRSIRENKLLIIDEINRADIDKAFGQLFTVLSGQSIELNYKKEGKPIKVELLNDITSNNSYYDEDSATYFVGNNWRIIASMNTSDKDSLFELSYAFMRRFAFVNITIPTQEAYSELISNWTTNLDPIYKQTIINLEELFNSKDYPNIGPAIFKDICNYLTYRKDFENKEFMLEEAITAFILPQFEGLSVKQINEIYNDFINKLELNDNIIKSNIEEILGIPLKLNIIDDS